MSATGTGFDSANALSGAFAFIGVSDDLSVADPTINWIAYRDGEITFTQEWENAEWAFPEQTGMVRQRTHNAKDLEFTLANHIGMSELKDLGIVDNSTDKLLDKIEKDIQIRVFKTIPDDVDTDTADLHIDCYTSELTFTEMGFATDGGQTTMAAYLNGDIEMYDPGA
jgi:hypothetical protein